ncbi:hypothetical protein Lsed01_00655 [Demequina sediminis]|uniref:GtrA/DPMS transmembrane domain-containing protein n=2 Tax=Demequina sediminis TaxID=1930058 RepID=A0ABP9WGX9_9MICO|nr:GtrA family protein [Demequina sediminis]BDZ62017.1 hypothetical protein GCM10025873_18080 [Demequina sediminis]
MGYGWTAAVGLIVDFCTLALLADVFSVHYLMASTSGFLSGLAVVFVLSERFVFRDPRVAHPWVRFSLFGVIGAIGLLLLNGQMWVFVEKLGWYYLVAKAVATVTVFAWNFLARRWMYRR